MFAFQIVENFLKMSPKNALDIHDFNDCNNKLTSKPQTRLELSLFFLFTNLTSLWKQWKYYVLQI